LEYEANVEIYNLPAHHMRRIQQGFGGTFGSTAVCWVDGKLGLSLEFRVQQPSRSEAAEHARLRVQMALGRLSIGLDGLEITVAVHPRPDGVPPHDVRDTMEPADPMTPW
jgi:hypothetical protein